MSKTNLIKNKINELNNVLDFFNKNKIIKSHPIINWWFIINIKINKRNHVSLKISK